MERKRGFQEVTNQLVIGRIILLLFWKGGVCCRFLQSMSRGENASSPKSAFRKFHKILKGRLFSVRMVRNTAEILLLAQME